MNDQRLVVIGGGGHSKVVVATLQACGREVVAIFDDDPRKWGESVLGVPVTGPIERWRESGPRQAIIAIGDNGIRRRFASELESVQGLTWATAVHPLAMVHPSVDVGRGTVIFAGAIVQPDSILGDHAIVNTGASVDHDCRLEDFVHVGPGANLAGCVTIGEGSLVGVGSAILPGISVGSWAVVGAGATVTKPVTDSSTVAGTPARRRQSPSGTGRPPSA